MMNGDMVELQRTVISTNYDRVFDVLLLLMEHTNTEGINRHESDFYTNVLPEIDFLLNLVIDDEFFIGDVLSKCSESASNVSHSYLHALEEIILNLSRKSQKVIKKWFSADLMGNSLIDLFFNHLPSVTTEVVCSTFLCNTSSFYANLCFSLYDLLAQIPGKCFCVVENCLISNLLSDSLLRTIFSSDVWYLILRNSSEELRSQHCRLLFKLSKLTSDYRHRNITAFLARILPMLKESQIKQYFTEFGPMKHPDVWTQSLNAEMERDMCVQFVQHYDHRTNSVDILPLVASFIEKNSDVDINLKKEFMCILVSTLKYNIEHKRSIESIPKHLNLLLQHGDCLPRVIIPSISYSLCFSDYNNCDTFKYLFGYLCSSLLQNGLSEHYNPTLIECLVKCCSQRTSLFTCILLYKNLYELCTTCDTEDLMRLINKKPNVRENLIAFIRQKQQICVLKNINEESSLIKKLFTIESNDVEMCEEKTGQP